MDARTDRQRAYEERFAALIGLRLSGVTYCVYADGGEFNWPLYREVGHWLDWGLEFRFDDHPPFSLGWDSEFVQFDIALFEGSIRKRVHPDANVLLVDISSEREWRPHVGREVAAVEVFWCEEKPAHPQDIAIYFDRLPPIYIGAREYHENGDCFSIATDHTFVVFSDDVARRYKIGSHDGASRSFGKIIKPSPTSAL